jgi:hypothetical protein
MKSVVRGPGSAKVAALMDLLSRGVSVFVCGCALGVLAPSNSFAQAGSSGDDVIEDPELAGTASSSSSSSGDESVIEDPELAGSTSSQSSGSGFNNSAAPQFFNNASVLWHSRLGMDLRYSDPREETWENTNIAVLDADIRRSESLRFRISTRLRLYAGALTRDVPDARAQRVELDATPTSGYVDWTITSGANLQVGYQSVQLGRFDIVSATDVLTIADTRNGPATLPDAYEVGQLAMKLDLDATPWLNFKVIYLPFFTPYIMSVNEGDYALLPLRQREVSADLDGLMINNVVAENLSRADRERLAMSGLAAFAPEIGFNKQQSALRITTHGGFGELALTATTAIEKVPSIYFSPEAIAYFDNPTPEVTEAFQNARQPIRVAYNRFYTLSLDAAFDVAPLSLGFEFLYGFNRTMPTLGTGPYPGTLPLPEQSDVAQAGARLEYLSGSEIAITVEAFGMYAMRTPQDPTRGWMFLEGGRYLAGVAAGGLWAPAETHLQFELGVIAMTPETIVIAPRVLYSVIDALQLELGALIIEGSAPPIAVTPRIAVGTIYDTVDQVFVGFIYKL